MKQIGKTLLSCVIGVLLFSCGAAFDFVYAAAPQDQSATSQTDSTAKATGSKELATLSPEELVALIKAPKSERPVILNVGPRLLYEQAHVPGAEYIGAAASSQGMQALRARAKLLPRDTSIVLYCGCCPWDRCPNIRPAFRELQTMGFTHVKALLIADDFGADWVYKGYPIVKGR